MGPPCKTHSFSVAKRDPWSLPLCGGKRPSGTETYPRRGSGGRAGSQQGKRKGRGTHSPRLLLSWRTSSLLWPPRVLALEFQGLSLLSWKVGGTEPIPWGSEVLQTGCWLRKWHLPRRKASPQKGYILYNSLQIAYSKSHNDSAMEDRLGTCWMEGRGYERAPGGILVPMETSCILPVTEDPQTCDEIV